MPSVAQVEVEVEMAPNDVTVMTDKIELPIVRVESDDVVAGSRNKAAKTTSVTIELPELDVKVIPEIRDLSERPLVRDTYLNEVFYELLEDDERPQGHDKSSDSEKSDKVETSNKVAEPVKTNVIPVVDKSVHSDNDLPRGGDIDVKVEPVKDFSNIELPKPEMEKNLDKMRPDRDRTETTDSGDDNKAVDLVDHSVPEPYMAEPMDDPLRDSGTEDDTSTSSYMDLIREREALQEDLANRRFQLRMEQGRKEMDDGAAPVLKREPVNEFKKE